jgi:deoxyribodipyrimidine photo-lyase
MLNSNLRYIDAFSDPSANNKSIREHKTFKSLFDSSVPDFIKGYKCEDRDKMIDLYPAGTTKANEVLERFFHTKSRPSQVGDSSPLADGAESSSNKSRIKEYMIERDQTGKDTTSRISPYLASGVISARECIRQTLKILNVKKIEGSRKTNVGMWVQEVGESKNIEKSYSGLIDR